MEKILNLTQHLATPEQVAQGVVDLSEQDRKALVSAITFEELPDVAIIENRAKKVCDIAVKYGIKNVMIGGAPFFMSTLEKALKSDNMVPVYAFSKRIVVEKQQSDGTVIKTAIFKHEGFIKV